MKLPKPPASDPDEKPKSLRERILTFLPIILTVLATILAGLSSGESTRSQYFRSLASQDQAKAADQWGYFQAKRARAVNSQNTLDLLNATSHPGTLSAPALRSASQQLVQSLASDAADSKRIATLDATLAQALVSPDWQSTVSLLDGHLPAIIDQPIPSAQVQQVLTDVEKNQTESEMAPFLRQITNADIAEARRVADANLAAFDTAFEPVGTLLDKLHTVFTSESQLSTDLTRQPAGTASSAVQPAVSSAQSDVAAARLKYAALRYDREARYNAVTGQICELEVARAGVFSSRAQGRSALFFYCMLAAQAGVVLSSFSLAIHRKNPVWFLAAIAGAAAVMASSYVYLFF